MSIARNVIRGSKALAEKLSVSQETVRKWRKSGILAPATLSDYGRVIIYDLDKVYECLNYRKGSGGRRSAV